MSAILMSDSEQSPVMESVQSTKKKKRDTLPTCSLCRNHNLRILSSGHKGRCLGMFCKCKKCIEKKQSRNQSKESTKKDRQEKKEQERQARIKLTGSELIRIEPEKDIIPFDIPKEDKRKLPKVILEDKNMMMIIKFSEVTIETRREVTIFIGQTERKRKVEIDEEDSSEKRLKDSPLETPIKLDLLRYALYMCCLRYDIRDTTELPPPVASLVEEIIAIILECTSSSEAKSRIYLVCQKIHELIESHYRKCLQENSVQCMHSFKKTLHPFNRIETVHPSNGIETLPPFNGIETPHPSSEIERLHSFWSLVFHHYAPSIPPYYWPNSGV